MEKKTLFFLWCVDGGGTLENVLEAPAGGHLLQMLYLSLGLTVRRAPTAGLIERSCDRCWGLGISKISRTFEAGDGERSCFLCVCVCEWVSGCVCVIEVG